MATVNDLEIKSIGKISESEGLTIILEIRRRRRERKHFRRTKSPKKKPSAETLINSMSEEQRLDFLGKITGGEVNA